MENIEPGEKAMSEHVNTIDFVDEDAESPTARGVEVDDIPANYWWSYRFLGSILSIILLANALFINFSLPANALTVINNDLGYSPSYIWISDGGLVVTCVGLLIVGRIGDIVGRRYFLVIGQVFGVVGSVVYAKATSINMLIAGSTIYGVASTTQLTFPYIIQELVPNKHRGIAQAVVLAGVVPFAGFGTIIARDLIQYSALGWRWCYMLNVVFNSVALLLLIFCYFPPNLSQLHSKLTWKTELKKLDYGGIFLFSAANVLVLVGLNWGGSTYPWSSKLVLGPLISGCILVVVFALYETYMPLAQPLLPMKLLKNRAYVALVVAASIGQMAFSALSILWPQQIEYVYTTDNVKIGWMSISSGLALVISEIIFGTLLRVVGHTRLQLIAAAVLMFAFLGAMAGTNQRTEGMAVAFTTLAGFFSGWLDVICLVANGLVNKPGDMGLANGFVGSIKQVVGTVSVSIYIAILQNRIAVNLPKDVAAAAVAAGLPSGSVTAAIEAASNGTAAAMNAVPGMNATIAEAVADGVKTAWSASFATVYYSSLAFAGIAIIAAFFSTDIDKYMTNYVSRRIGGTVAMNVAPEKTTKNGHLTDED